MRKLIASIMSIGVLWGFFVWAGDRLLADSYSPNDSLYLMVACYDTTIYPTLANPDSVWFYRYLAGAVVDSVKVTTAVRTGIVLTKIKASNTANAYGYYSAFALVFKGGKRGAKTWNWKVGADSTLVKDKTGFSLASTGSDLDTSLAKIKSQVFNNADSLNLIYYYGLNKADSAFYMRTDWNNIKNPTTAVNFSGMQIRRADSAMNVANINSLDTIQANLIPADSLLISGIKAKTDQLGFTAVNKVDANIHAIMNDGTAADNLNEAFDGDATGSGLISTVTTTGTATNVTTVNDKTGYSLLLSEKQMIADTSAMETWIYGTRGLTDESGFTLASGEYTNIWQTNISAYSGAGYAGTYSKNMWDKLPSPLGTWKFLADTTWTATKAGYMDEAISGIDDNPWNNPKSDTASGMGDWFADWYNAGYWLTATGFLTKAVFDDSIDGKATYAQASAIIDSTRKIDTTLITTRTQVFDNADSLSLIRAEIVNMDGWNPITDQESLVVDLSSLRQLRIKYVDSLGEELTITSVDSVRKVYLVDSLDQIIVASTDTVPIKTMMRNNWDVNANGEWDTVEYIKAGSITASCEGTGVNTLTVRIRNNSDSTALSGFNVVIEDSATGGWYRSGATNSSGNCVFGVEDGSYVIYVWAPRWIITSPRYFNITANMDSTFYATLYTPSPPPPGDSVVIVYGYVRHVDNTPYENARVRMWIPLTGIAYQGALVYANVPTVTYTDSLGYFEFSHALYKGQQRCARAGIYPNAILTPVNTKWWIEIVAVNITKIYENWVTIPVGDSYEITVPPK